MGTIRNFVCNRTSEKFLKDQESKVKLLFGCVGSGKSSTCVINIYSISRTIPKGYDGIRRSRWAVIRSTYSQLATTTVKTWKEWLPESVFGKVKGDSPMTHLIKHDDVEMEVIFLALDSESDINRLKSLELTGAYLNEAQFVYNRDIVSTILERTNRFPGQIFGGGLKNPLLIMDCNPPSTHHWIYHIFEKERPNGWNIYKMPPALIKDSNGIYINNPDADFLTQVPDPDYWLKLSCGATEEYIRVSLCGEYGILEEGRPVHPEFNDKIHYTTSKINANENCEIGLGWDFGNTPACAIVQVMADGQFVVLDELWTEYMSVRSFAEDVVIPYLDRNFYFWRKNYVSIHDPAGNSMNSDGNTCQSILRELGIISSAAQSNACQFRRDGLKFFLTKMIGGYPAFLMSEKCHMIREGLMGKFKYDIIKSSIMRSSKEYQEKPLKNIYSHICEALEYICTFYASNNKNYDIKKNADIIAQEFSKKTRRINDMRSSIWQK